MMFFLKLIRWWHDARGHEPLLWRIDDREVAYHFKAPCIHSCSCGKELGRYFFTDSDWWKNYKMTHTQFLGTYGPPL